MLDEIEKAHPDVLAAFMAVLDEGRVADGRGRLVDFTSTVILLTSSFRRRRGQPGPAVARRVPSWRRPLEMRSIERIAQAARHAFYPGSTVRLDEGADLRAALARRTWRASVTDLLKRLGDELELLRGIALHVEPGVVDHLLDHGGYDAELGARPLRRTIARLVEAPLAEALLAGRVRTGELGGFRGSRRLEFHSLPRGVSAAE